MKVLIVDDEPSQIATHETQVKKLGYQTISALSGEDAIKQISNDPEINVVMIDQKMPNMNGLQLGKKLNEINPSLYKIMVTAYGDMVMVINAMRIDFDDFLTKPAKYDDIRIGLMRAQKALEQKQYAFELRRQLFAANTKSKAMIGDSPAFKKVLDLAKSSAQANSTVLIHGETGTGKELIVRFIHDNSSRKKEALVVCNCSALPETLIESELFGCKKGAFTDAHADRKGLVELADKGTLFLDEVGELPLNVQQKFLRLLQEKQYTCLGGNRLNVANIRIVAATHKNLEEMVKKGTFREDLYYRLNVINLTVPPLRERREDIPLLAKHFVEKKAKDNDKEVEISEGSLSLLSQLPFPGNIRELENLVEKLVVINKDGKIDEHQVREQLPSSTPIVEPVSRPPREISTQEKWWSELDAETVREFCQGLWDSKGEIIDNNAEKIPSELMKIRPITRPDDYLRAILAIFFYASYERKMFKRSDFDALFGWPDENKLKLFLKRKSQGKKPSPSFPVPEGKKQFGVLELKKDGPELEPQFGIFFDIEK